MRNDTKRNPRKNKAPKGQQGVCSISKVAASTYGTEADGSEEDGDKGAKEEQDTQQGRLGPAHHLVRNVVPVPLITKC